MKPEDLMEEHGFPEEVAEDKAGIYLTPEEIDGNYNCWNCPEKEETQLHPKETDSAKFSPVWTDKEFLATPMYCPDCGNHTGAFMLQEVDDDEEDEE